MNQRVETELQKILAAYREQAGEIERQVAAIAELRQRMSAIDAEIETAKTALTTAPHPPVLDLAVIRTLAEERRETERHLEQLGRERAKIAARMRDAERARRAALEQDLKDCQQQCWKALFDQLKVTVDVAALETLLVAGLQAGLDESAIRAEIVPHPADRGVIVARLRAQFGLPG